MRGAFLVIVLISVGIVALLTKRRSDAVPPAALQALSLQPGEAAPKTLQELPAAVGKRMKAIHATTEQDLKDASVGQ